MKHTRIWIALILIAIATSGCDDRASQIAQQAADRQAEQNRYMAELTSKVTEGTEQLIVADGQARQDMARTHRELQAERSQLNTGWQDLETERRIIATERRTEALLSSVLQTLGLLLVVALLLGFCWQVLARASTQEVDSTLSSLLIDECLLPQLPLADSNSPLLKQQHD